MVKEQGAAADEQAEVLGHVALLDRVHADILQGAAEQRDRGGAIELAAVLQAAGPAWPGIGSTPAYEGKFGTPEPLATIGRREDSDEFSSRAGGRRHPRLPMVFRADARRALRSPGQSGLTPTRLAEALWTLDCWLPYIGGCGPGGSPRLPGQLAEDVVEGDGLTVSTVC